MEPQIVITILEMLRDRKYKFDPRFHPDKLLKEIKFDDYKTPSDHQKAIQEYHQMLRNIPFISNPITNTSLLPLDDKGTPIYVYIQEGNEITNPFGDNQPDRLALAKQLVLNLKKAYPEFSSAKKLYEIYGTLHLIVVFNGVKHDLIKLEHESFKQYNFEAFPKKRLRFNVTKHELNGRKTKLSKSEAEQYREKYQSVIQTMQIYRIDDSIVRYYYGQPGDIFHCLRRGGGENYRVVVRKTKAAHDKS